MGTKIPGIPQPAVPFVELAVGDFNLTPIPPQYLLNLNHRRNMLDTANEFSFSIYDDTAIELELAIAEGHDNVRFRYGWVNGESTPVFSGKIWDYTIEFQSGGAVLNVTGTSTALEAHAVAATATYAGLDIHDIVKQIAKREGWKVGYIEPCVPITGYYANEVKEKVKKPFTQKNVSSTKFIKEQLIPYAISSKTGEGGFNLYFEDTSKTPTVYFAPPNYKKAVTKSLNLDINAGRRSAVVSFTPEVKGSLLMQGGGTVEATAIDSLSNNMTTLTYSDSSNASKTLTGPKSIVDFKKGKQAINLSSASLQEMSHKAASLWSKNANLMYSASLEMIGDPTMKANSLVEVNVVTNKGKPHHTSGIYLVTEVDDDISGGMFMSNLKLMKNATSAGAINRVGTDVNDIKTTVTSTVPKPPAPPAPAATKKYYVVKKGDTLWGIAASMYGSGAKYPKILSANPQIKNKNLIYPGQKLLIP